MKNDWADGVLVNEKKAIAWLQEDVFKMRIPLTKREKAAHQKKLGKLPEASSSIVWDDSDESMAEFAEKRGLSQDQVLAMYNEFQFDMERDSVIEPEAVAGPQGNLLKWQTIHDSYVSALAELYNVQVAMELNTYPNWRGPGLKALMESERSKQDAISRSQFDDRGAGGVNTGYSEKELLALQVTLLKRAYDTPTVSCPNFCNSRTIFTSSFILQPLHFSHLAC